jgi:acetoin utilization deacetylase AcuC-like enzyme
VATTEEEYLTIIEEAMEYTHNCDIIVGSAGFDQGINDWGKLLRPEAYNKIGELMKTFSIKHCEGRRYALLEGGYNYIEMAKAVKNFCEGFR